MNEYPKRYELKLRSESSGGRKNYEKDRISAETGKSAAQESGISFRTGFCVMVLVAVMFLKFIGGERGQDILSEIDSLINSQFDIEKTTLVMAEFMDDARDYFSGNNNGPVLYIPVKNGEIYEGFTDTVHPVFMTNVSPTGITISAEPSAYVYSAQSGKVSSVSQNSDGTKRVVIKYNKDMSIAYDNLSNVYVKENDLVDKEHIIGLLKEDDPKLVFEVWVDNTAVDPLRYMDMPMLENEKDTV